MKKGPFGNLLDLFYGLRQRMAVIRVAVLGKHTDYKVITVRGGNTYLDSELIFFVSLKIANGS